MIFVICGQTASGKSKLALDLAKKIDGYIVNADAFQVYKELNIGTAKPSIEERQVVPHFLYDICSVENDYTVKEYQNDARKIISDNKDKPLIFVGGTGLYIRSTFYDYEFRENVEVDMEAFNNLTNEELHDYLAKIDKESSEQIHKNNRRRLLRAIEIYLATGMTKSEIEKEQKKEIIYDDVVFIGLDIPKKVLEERISLRVEDMFKNGLEAEIAELFTNYDKNLRAFSAIGYRQFAENEELTTEELKELIKLRTRQYAKRQKTFFKNQLPIKWFKSHDEALKYMVDIYNTKKEEK
ncbi:MAG: tRNA (adenosine(37)-N6)-dimethylallyltransferase MiaA [Bacilli bacterium]|jgi:tRNA dimethylallyltransferase